MNSEDHSGAASRTACAPSGAIQSHGIDMITGLASLLAVQESAVHSQIAATVADKQIDAIEQQGAAANELLEAAVKLSKSLSTGGNFDAVA